ncbi:pentapeptide repeat-containing protein [Nocardiopsis sp. YSL2]|uniref:pentapeptide repeat-containing protein n=1 Tax=Nocardiopsis sp. YSL2 TaxID=2939492 RepID=UPI0026F440DD|nr:pentapeptide repeat-containing protein [Nocardiopsis sp. YSL2]
MTGLAWLVLETPRWEPPDDLTPKGLEAITTRAFAIVAGLGGVALLVIAYRRQRAVEAEAQRAELTVVREDTKLFNERFTTAYSELGSEHAAVRLGAIHALAHLADDAPSDELVQMVIDVLCAYLRMPYDLAPDPLPKKTTTARREEHRARKLDFAAFREVRHTVIRVIGNHLREPTRWRGRNYDFTGVEFDGGSFHGAEFTGGYVSFRFARFKGRMSFDGVTFSGGQVSFDGADFCGERVSFRFARFAGSQVYFRFSTLSCQVSFENAKFISGQVKFDRARFASELVRFDRSAFVGGQLSFDLVRFIKGRVDFNGARFTGGSLGFKGARFSGSQVDFSGAEFSGSQVDFSLAVFSGGEVTFSGSSFSGSQVSFSGAGFSGSQVKFRLAVFSGGHVSFRNSVFSGGQVSFIDAVGTPPSGLLGSLEKGGSQVIVLPALWKNRQGGQGLK